MLNNSRREGLARRAAATFTAGGWAVHRIAGLPGRTSRTTVYYAEGHQAAARAFAAAFPAVQRVHPAYSGLPVETGLTVVVTREFPV